MATSQNTQVVSVIAGEASVIYTFVSLQADGKYDITGATTERMHGIAAEGGVPDGGALAMVIPNGAIAKVKAGAAVTLGAQVQSDSTGRAIDHVSGVGVVTAGIALDAAAAADDIIRIQFLIDIDQVA
jgi:hypothetical protein